MPRAYVGLGANLGDRERTILRAVELLEATPGVALVGQSALRETEPVGYVDQPRFLNGAVALDTGLSARELLECLLEIERELGRVRAGPRFGPRVIDLDLLLYGAERVDQPGLRIPHPRVHERAFALEPLAELDPKLDIPGRGSVEALLAKLESTG
jgi:2-amino-4-hydroxy-6-hydroxymethyldihydropteridine diphosphokinase